MQKMCRVLLIASIAFVFPIDGFLEDRIVGGNVAAEGAFPYLASLQNEDGHVCGGAILDQYFILTVAHCVSPLKFASMGSRSLDNQNQTHVIEKATQHPDFDSVTNANDIALIRLQTPIQFSRLVQPISISAQWVEGDVPVTLSGWGQLTIVGPDPVTLRYVNLRTASNSYCTEFYEKGSKRVTENVICTRNEFDRGACFGDSGSPLVGDGGVVGLVSWGTACAIGIPDAFTRVSQYVDWIRNIVDLPYLADRIKQN